MVFDNDNFSLERLKNSFITYLTSWAGFMFLGWLVLLTFLLSFLCIHPVYSGAWPCFVNILFSLLIKKKKSFYLVVFLYRELLVGPFFFYLKIFSMVNSCVGLCHFVSSLHYFPW